MINVVYHVTIMVLWFLQPVGFVTFATKDDAEAAKLELQVFIAFFLLTFFSVTVRLFNSGVSVNNLIKTTLG